MKMVWNDNVLSWRKGGNKKFRIAVAGDVCPACGRVCIGWAGFPLWLVANSTDIYLRFSGYFSSFLRDVGGGVKAKRLLVQDDKSGRGTAGNRQRLVRCYPSSYVHSNDFFVFVDAFGAWLDGGVLRVFTLPNLDCGAYRLRGKGVGKRVGRLYRI